MWTQITCLYTFCKYACLNIQFRWLCLIDSQHVDMGLCGLVDKSGPAVCETDEGEYVVSYASPLPLIYLLEPTCWVHNMFMICLNYQSSTKKQCHLQTKLWGFWQGSLETVAIDSSWQWDSLEITLISKMEDTWTCLRY